MAMLGGWLGAKARFPGSIAVGAMLLAILGNVAIEGWGFGRVILPPWYKTGIQIMAGCVVGSSMTLERAKGIKRVLLPVLINSAILLSVGLGLSVVARRVFGWDFLTSWLATCPGRMADMIIYSGVLGADTATVVAAHVLRLVAVILFTPILLKLFGLIFHGRFPAAGEPTPKDPAPGIPGPGSPASEEASLLGPSPASVRTKGPLLPKYLLLFTLGIVGGWLGLVSGLAGGVILGAMLLTSLGNLVGLPASHLPRGFGSWLQMLAGLLVGSQMALQELTQIAGSLIELLVIILSLMCASLLSAYILISRFKWDSATAWLSASPGRMSDMIILSQSLGAKSDWVAGTHVVRMILVIILTPLIMRFS
jgi:membrane AbrB-like protein